MTRWSLGGFALSLLTLLACASSPSQPNSMPADNNYPELRQLVVERGRLQVIVGVKIDSPALPESIRNGQDALLRTLPGEHVEEASRFEAIPFLVLRVDAAGLDALMASELVTSIEEDQASPSSR